MRSVRVVRGEAADGGAEIAVVHLARAANGADPFRRFLASYRACPAGSPHRLVILFKGFDGMDLAPYDSALAGMPHDRLFIDDAGLDLGAYFAAAHALTQRFLCFLNSYSIVRDAGWLAKLHRHAVGSGIAVVGASGSHESLYSQRRELAASPVRPVVRRLLDGALATWHAATYRPFPNPHLRTNCFMIRRKAMLLLRRRRLATKAQALAFESGRRGLTAQALATGGRVLVIGRDGRAYGVREWSRSHTFRSGGQENLLVSDNRTNEYDAADGETRARLARATWLGWRPPR